MSSDDPNSALASFRWLWPYVRPHRFTLLGVGLLAALISALATALPYLSKHIIDDGLIGRRFGLLVALCGVVVVLAAIGFGLGALNRLQYVRMSGRILFALREDVYAHLLKLSPEFFRSRPVGDLVTRLDGDVAEVQRFSTDTLLAFVNGVLLLVATGAIMAVMSWKLALVAACALPVHLWLRHRAGPYIAGTTRSVREQSGRITQFLVETLGSAKAVQGAAAERWESGRLVDLNRSYLSRLVSQQLAGYTVGGISSLLSHLTTAAVFIVGGYYVMQGSLTVGTLVAFTAYLTRTTGSAVSLMNLYTAYQRAAVSLQRVRELLDAPAAQSSHEGERRMTVPADVAFEGVTYQPPGAERPVLEGLRLEGAAGAKIVVFGDSGSGKSTLADLLRRFAEPQEGRVSIGGREVSEYSLELLRRHVTVLETKPAVFRGSLSYNLRYGHFEASEAEVREAARRAGVDSFVEVLPQGYDTEIGSGGVGLSTGQLQRIAISRALLGNPVVLVLDEATSNLDAVATRAMHDLIDRHFAECTRIVITHAPHAVPRADALYELCEGRLMLTERAGRAHG